MKELKQKENYTGIYKYMQIYQNIVRIGAIKQILLHFQKLSLGGALENNCS